MADTSLTALAFTNRRAGVERLPGQPPERGSASLIGLALCAFVVIATLVTADVGALAFARARAQTAADLAALAAVTPHPSGPLEQSRPWDVKAIVGPYRLLQRVWRVVVDEMTDGSGFGIQSRGQQLYLIHRGLQTLIQGLIDQQFADCAFADLDLSDNILDFPQN